MSWSSEVAIHVDAADLSRMRWAISPLWELVASVRALATPGQRAIHMPWLSAHRQDPLAVGSSAGRTLITCPIGGFAGFLAPTPHTPLANLDDELRELALTPVDVVRAELRSLHGDDLPPALRAMYRAPRRELRGFVAEVAAYWHRAIDADWPRMRALLESDIHHRARQLTTEGPARMFDALHPDLAWREADHTLTVRLRHPVAERHRHLDGRGLVLVPSVFAWPDLYVKTSQPWLPVIRYPVRGVATLYDSSPSCAPDLAAVLGHTRARLLSLLETPGTTDELARHTGLAAGGISAHLSRLLAADLVSAHRIGRAVLYARTGRAEALLATG